MTAGVRLSLTRRRIGKVCHFTPCDRLPSILTHGLCSYRERQRLGIAEPEEEHYWGTHGKKEALADYVICSFMPPWGMIQAHREEIAIITLDAEMVCCGGQVAFCPGNSAFNAYPAEQIKTWTGLASFDACFPNEETYQAGSAEIFVPTRVPVKAFREILFPDLGARDYWAPILQTVQTDEELPPGPIKLIPGGIPGFRFPGGWTPEERVRA